MDWHVYSQPKTAMPYILLAVCNVLFPDVMISRWGGEFGTTLRAAQDVAKTAQSKGFVAELKTLDEVSRQLWDVSSISCSVNVFMVLHACWATGNDSWNDLFVRTATCHPLQLNSHPTKQLTQSWSCFVPQPARYHPKILYLVRSRSCGCNSSALTWWLICWDNGLEPRIDGQIPFVLVMVATHLWWHFSCAVVVDTGIHDMAKPRYNGHPPELLGVILLKKCRCTVWVCYKMFFFFHLFVALTSSPCYHSDSGLGSLQHKTKFHWSMRPRNAANFCKALAELPDDKEGGAQHPTFGDECLMLQNLPKYLMTGGLHFCIVSCWLCL